MNTQITALFLAAIALCIYAWIDWFKALCGLIVFTSFVMHPSFPSSIAGIQGLNLWNLVFANISLAWLLNRRREGLFWDMPREINVFLVLWLGVLLFAWVRMVVDRSTLTEYTLLFLVSDDLINTIKWPIISLLLFDGCRTRYRAKIALACIFLLFVLFTVQISRAVPSKAVFETGKMDLRMELDDEIGISPNGAGKMMSGVPWAMMALMPLLKQKWKYRFLMLGACVSSIYALSITGSRSGYIACFATSVFLCFIRWRRYLPLIPLAVLILPFVFPGAVDRAFDGFDETTVTGERENDKDAITSGRNEIWAVVIPKIFDSPVWGYGRKAMRRTGLQDFLLNQFGQSGMAVSHPHNAYLEVLLESGLIGLVVVVGLYMFVWVYSIRLFVDRGDPLYTAAGGFTLALLTGHLVAFMGGQSLYPRETDVGLWCAIGVMLRFYVDRESSRHQGELYINCQHMCYQGQSNLTHTPLNWHYS